MNKSELHKKALAIAQKYRRCEIELVEILEQVDRLKICYQHGCNSTYQYAVQILGLSEAVASIFITVSRKAREVPSLKSSIANGQVTVSKACKMTSVLNRQNSDYWLEFAKNKSTRALERQVAMASPRKTLRDRVKYVPSQEVPAAAVKGLPPKSAPRVQLQMGLSEKQMLQLRRAQEVLSQKRQRAVGLDEVLEAMSKLYLEKHDPVLKAQRQKVRGTLHVKDKSPQSVKGRVSIPATIKHQVYIESEGRCSYINAQGKRCQSRTFLQIHHDKPVARGGGNEPSNLSLLCAGHHRVVHEMASKKD